MYDTKSFSVYVVTKYLGDQHVLHNVIIITYLVPHYCNIKNEVNVLGKAPGTELRCQASQPKPSGFTSLPVDVHSHVCTVRGVEQSSGALREKTPP